VLAWRGWCEERQSHFLVRVRRNLPARVVEVLRDGRALVEWVGRDEAGGKQQVLGREIRGRVLGRGGKVTALRLWTSWLDVGKYPGLALVGL
jgi:hypothetical protein